jgi:CheY-like chemotaxis protein
MTKKVLIVEDNPLIAAVLEMLVEDELGCVAVSAPSVGKARNLIESGVDMALLDVEVEDGVTYGLATDCLQNDIPVIFVSGSEPGKRPREIAHTPFIRKPFCDADLLSVARKYVKGH